MTNETENNTRDAGSLTKANASAAAAMIRQNGGPSRAADSCAHLAITGETINYSGRPMANNQGRTLCSYGYTPGKYHYLHNPNGPKD
jgi:hypothetical protein